MRDFQAIFAQIHSVTLVNSLNVDIRRRVQLRYIRCYADDGEGVAAKSRSHSYVSRYQLSDFYDFYELYDFYDYSPCLPVTPSPRRLAACCPLALSLSKGCPLSADQGISNSPCRCLSNTTESTRERTSSMEEAPLEKK
jgi:hypothetical protein